MDGTTRSDLGKLRLRDLMREGSTARRASGRRRYPRRPFKRETTTER